LQKSERIPKKIIVIGKTIMATLDKALDTVMQLKPKQREMLIAIVQRRESLARREEIARDADNSIAAFHAGELKTSRIEDIIAELRQSLWETDEE
jgi:hypothetical protein